ncbi:MAG TPA: molybdopterin-binding protein [Nitrososphaera sp.]|jgi:molybdenum cofactor synthesis domain-containing protein|nr:molybdopterin-binding protein [Nitrososphaera sp.]
MIIEILCIGTELLSGITLNTNAYSLCSEITNVGGVVRRVTVVCDDLIEISSAMRESLTRKPDILITTGGLGATYDDMTFEALAAALGKKVVLDGRAVEMLKRSYERRNLHYELTGFRLKMATIPEGSTPIQNPVGSAPAVMEQVENVSIFCLPGVPSEMQAIFEEYILPQIKKSVGKFVAEELNYNTRGLTEAMIAPVLIKIVQSHPKNMIYLKTHPRGYYRKKTPQIKIQLISRGNNEKEVKNRLATISKIIEKEIVKRGGIIC